MLAINEENLRFAVQAIFFIVGMVNETSFIAKASSINSPVTIKVEEKG